MAYKGMLETGEVNWLVQDAINKEISIPIISQSVTELFKSRIKDSGTFKSIAHETWIFEAIHLEKGYQHVIMFQNEGLL